MTPPTMLDETVLEELEVEFLRSPSGSWPLRPETRLPVLELPAPVVGWPADDEPQARLTRYRTRTGCCG